MCAKNKKKLFVVIYIIILLVIIGIIGFFAYFTNGFTSDFKMFYVDCNNKKIMDSESGFVVTPTNPLIVGVHSMFGKLYKGAYEYEISIVPIADFCFVVDDQIFGFKEELEISEGFDIEYFEHGFKITPKGLLKDILSCLYPNQTITVDKQSINFDETLFNVVIKTKDNKNQIILSCLICDYPIDSVALDKEVIVF